jgi:nucleotide-binding universal stress UspA family protein
MLAIRNVVIATDFSECSDAALAYAREICRTFGAQLHPLHVVETLAAPDVAGMGGYVAAMPTLQHELEEAARKQLDERLTEEDRGPLQAEAVVRTGDGPARAIIEFAGETRADLIVLGTHGRRGLSHLVMGSVAERVVRTATCPVLTVREFPRLATEPIPERASAGAPSR